MRVAIHTLGCKVNQYESQAMEELLRARGHSLVPFEAHCRRIAHAAHEPPPQHRDGHQR